MAKGTIWFLVGCGVGVLVGFLLVSVDRATARTTALFWPIFIIGPEAFALAAPGKPLGLATRRWLQATAGVWVGIVGVAWLA